MVVDHPEKKRIPNANPWFLDRVQPGEERKGKKKKKRSDIDFSVSLVSPPSSFSTTTNEQVTTAQQPLTLIITLPTVARLPLYAATAGTSANVRVYAHLSHARLSVSVSLSMKRFK